MIRNQLMASLIFFVSLMAHANPPPLSWGVETWQCGNSNYTIQIGSGADVHVTAIVGNVSAGIIPKTDPEMGYMHQSTLAIYWQGISNNINGSIYASPTNGTRYQHSLDGNMYSINMKQTGTEVINTPINVTYPDPILVPGGRLSILIDTRTYDGSSELLSPPNICMDTEAHFLIFYY